MIYDGIYNHQLLAVSRKNFSRNRTPLAPFSDKPSILAAACPVCAARRQAGTTEIYLLSEGADRYFFNVDAAKKIVSDGRSSILIARQTIRRMMKVNDYTPMHLTHVDAKKPGIVLQRFGGLVLVDGIHRAVLSLQQKRAFHATMLSYQESLDCVVRQEIASTDAGSIVEKLRRVMATAPASEPIEAELECTAEVLAQVRAALTPEERQRLILKAVPPRRIGS